MSPRENEPSFPLAGWGPGGVGFLERVREEGVSFLAVPVAWAAPHSSLACLAPAPGHGAYGPLEQPEASSSTRPPAVSDPLPGRGGASSHDRLDLFKWPVQGTVSCLTPDWPLADTELVAGVASGGGQVWGSAWPCLLAPCRGEQGVSRPWSVAIASQ